MKKGEIFEGYVERVDFPNKGVVVLEDKNSDGSKTVVRAAVKGVLPGQTVQVRIKKARKTKCQAMLLEVVKPSEKETEKPSCPNFGKCGGCNYQTLSYQSQLALKKEQVLALIRPVCEGKSEFIYDGIVASPNQWCYRNKMEYSFGDEVKDGPLTLGLHKKGSFHDIIHAGECKLVHPDFGKIVDCVRDFFAEKQIPHFRKNSHEGILRHLLVRSSQSRKEILVALVTSSQYEEEPFSALLEELGKRLQAISMENHLVGFLHIINDSLADVVQSDRTDIVFGQDWFVEDLLGLQFRITPFSFFQTNTFGAERLYQRAREYVLNMGKTTALKEVYFADEVKENNEFSDVDLADKTVYDLYCGTGTITQIIAASAKKVIGVEIVEEAVEAARENAAKNGLTNCEFIAGDVLKVLDDIEEKPDYIILDPPRDGIHPKALRRIIDYGVENIVYISCKPTSLARDLEVFQESGYEMKRMCNVDLFSNTVHVESVCLLSKVHN